MNNALGTEYDLNGNIITSNGKVVTSYDKLNEQIGKNIEARKKQIKAQEYEELYRESIKRQIEAEREQQRSWEARVKAHKDFMDSDLANVNNFVGGVKMTFDKHTRDIVNNVNTTVEVNEKAKDNVKKTAEDVAYYEKLLTGVISEETQKTSKEIQEIPKATQEIPKTIETVTPQVQTRFGMLAEKIKNAFGHIDLSSRISIDTSKAYSAGQLAGENTASGYKSGLSKVGNLIAKFKSSVQNLILGKFSISAAATGGFPDVGEMFIAREAGPELVGKIGNRNAVLNNQQIVELVSSGVAQAVSAVMGGQQGASYKLYIDGKELTDVVQERINRTANTMGY